MKTSTRNMLLATAAFVAASIVMSAETLTANIPFPFQANGVAMAPGSYELKSYSGEAWFQLRDLHGESSIFVSSGTRETPPSAWTKAGMPKLAFTCGERGCMLSRIWTGTSEVAHGYNTSQKK